MREERQERPHCGLGGPIALLRFGGQRLTVLTAYDYTMARLFDEAGVDAILVGDSMGMVIQGMPHCLGVRLEDVDLD